MIANIKDLFRNQSGKVSAMMKSQSSPSLWELFIYFTIFYIAWLISSILAPFFVEILLMVGVPVFEISISILEILFTTLILVANIILIACVNFFDRLLSFGMIFF